MSMEGSNKNKLLIGAAAATVVIGGVAAWYMLSQSSEETADEFKPKSHRTTATTAKKEASPKTSPKESTVETTEASATAKPVVEKKETEKKAGRLERSDTLICNEYSFDGPKDASASAEPSSLSAPKGNAGQPDENGVVHFPHVGLVLQLHQGWNINEDMAPMPNVMVIGLSKTEWSSLPQDAPGAVPIVLLSVEDISNENLTLQEFKDKSKNMAITQMMMMTQGMIQPTISFDGPLHVGAFTHCLEYEQSTPMFKIQVLNLIAAKGGLAFVFQLMCSPAEFAKVRSEVIAIAKSVVIDTDGPEKPFDQSSFLEVKGPAGSIRCPSAWSMTNARAHKAGTALFDLKNGSSQKTELISVYDSSDLEAVTKQWKEFTSKDLDGASVKVYKESGRNERKVVEANGVAVVASPLMNASVSTSEQQLITIAKSFNAANSANAPAVTFNTPRLGYSHIVESNGRIIDSRVGERTIVYAPLGLSQDTDNPIMTVRVGDPTNDPDCRPSLDEWEARIKSETQPGISKVKQETIGGRRVVTFENREMVETGPNTREERLAKVIIFLKESNDGTPPRTTMFRWETPSNAFRKTESLFNRMLNSVELQ